MKIDRNKLNIILRSGIRKDIDTRKKLAAQLQLEPTSLTRWFASNDSAGNPRYPVVPDRHVMPIIQLFSLEPTSLSLSDEAFRQYCFEKALQLAKDREGNKKDELVQKQHAGSLNLPRTGVVVVCSLVLLGLSFGMMKWFLSSNVKDDRDLQSSITDNAQAAFDAGLVQMQQANYQSAINYFEQVNTRIQVLGDINSPLREKAMFNVGVSLYGLGPWYEAREHYQTTLVHIEQRASGNDTEAQTHETAEGSRSVARSEMERGKDYLAYPYISSSIEHDKQYFGEDHPLMATNWLLLSQILALQNKFGEAKLIIEKALTLDTQLFGEEHPRVAEDRMTLALIALQQGEISFAVEQYTLACAAFEAAGLELSEGNRSEGLILTSLQSMLATLKNSADIKSSQLLQQSLGSLSHALNANSPYIARRLAIVLRQQAIKHQLI